MKRFDLLLVNLGDNNCGSEQSGIRPVVVVGNDDSCKYSPVILVMPFTRNLDKTKIPTHHIIKSEIGGLKTDSLLVGEQPTPVSRDRIIKHLGYIRDESNREKIDQACFDAFFYTRNNEGAMA